MSLLVYPAKVSYQVMTVFKNMLEYCCECLTPRIVDLSLFIEKYDPRWEGGLLIWFKSKRSMEYEETLFYDHIGGKNVNLYLDRYGVEWMATSKWAPRVKRGNDGRSD